GARARVSDDGNDLGAVDELLGDYGCTCAAAGIVREDDLELTVRPPRRAGVDLLDGELDALFVGVAVTLAPRTSRAEGDRTGRRARTSSERNYSEKTFGGGHASQYRHGNARRPE